MVPTNRGGVNGLLYGVDCQGFEHYRPVVPQKALAPDHHNAWLMPFVGGAAFVSRAANSDVHG